MLWRAGQRQARGLTTRSTVGRAGGAAASGDAGGSRGRSRDGGARLEDLVKDLTYFTDSEDHPAFLKALAEVRKIGVHEGWCYHHVQAIILAIDQYAEAATGNREFFWNKPYSIGRTGKGDIP